MLHLSSEQYVYLSCQSARLQMRLSTGAIRDKVVETSANGDEDFEPVDMRSLPNCQRTAPINRPSHQHSKKFPWMPVGDRLEALLPVPPALVV